MNTITNIFIVLSSSINVLSPIELGVFIDSALFNPAIVLPLQLN